MRNGAQAPFFFMSLQNLHQLFLNGHFEECLRGCEAAQKTAGLSGPLAYVKAYALLRLNRTEDAIQAFRECLELGIESPDVSRNILSGNLALRKNLQECLLEARTLWQSDPTNEVNLSNLMLALLLNLKEVEFETLLQSIKDRLSPNQLSHALLIASKFKSAKGDHAGEFRLIRESLTLSPDNLQSLEALAIHYRDVLHDYPSAIAIFKPLADAGFPEAKAEVSHSRLRSCEWKDYKVDVLSLAIPQSGGLTHPTVCNPIVMLAHTFDPLEQDAYARIFCDATYGRPAHVADARPRRNSDVLKRIAFVSSDFRDHPIGYLVENFFLELNQHLEVLALYSSQLAADSQTERLKQNVSHFEDISDWSLSDKLSYVQGNEVDVLIDLNGLTKGLDYRLISAVRAKQVCPVYAWLGYPGPMPTTMFDKIILDAKLQTGIPEKDWGGYIFLKNCYQPNNFHQYKPLRESKTARESGKLTLAVTSNAFKITPEVFDVWCRLLSRIRNVEVFVLCDSAYIRGNLTREFRSRGVPDRFTFWDRVNHNAHIQRLANIDLVLDTFPYSNHTGTSDALSVGTPLVTIVGDTVASKVCGSILERVGLECLISKNLSEYEEILFRFASDLEFRESIRLITADLQSSPVFDMSLLATEFVERLRTELSV